MWIQYSVFHVFICKGFGKMKKVDIIIDCDVERFKLALSNAINDGWKLQGSMIIKRVKCLVTPDAPFSIVDDFDCFYQMIIKEEKE
jgi:hypothetical protein